MTDNELLMAISEIVDKKINAAVQPIKNDMRAIKVDLLENNVLPRLSSMEEHYVATAN